jgi:hypothetical protein
MSHPSCAARFQSLLLRSKFLVAAPAIRHAASLPLPRPRFSAVQKYLAAERRLIASISPGREYRSAMIELETKYFGDV